MKIFILIFTIILGVIIGFTIVYFKKRSPKFVEGYSEFELKEYIRCLDALVDGAKDFHYERYEFLNAKYGQYVFTLTAEQFDEYRKPVVGKAQSRLQSWENEWQGVEINVNQITDDWRVGLRNSMQPDPSKPKDYTQQNENLLNRVCLAYGINRKEYQRHATHLKLCYEKSIGKISDVEYTPHRIRNILVEQGLLYYNSFSQMYVPTPPNPNLDAFEVQERMSENEKMRRTFYL